MINGNICNLCAWNSTCKHLDGCTTNILGETILDKSLSEFNDIITQLGLDYNIPDDVIKYYRSKFFEALRKQP